MARPLGSKNTDIGGGLTQLHRQVFVLRTGTSCRRPYPWGSSQPSVDKGLTCPEGQSAWALAPSLSGEILASGKKHVCVMILGKLVPRRMKLCRFLLWVTSSHVTVVTIVTGGIHAVAIDISDSLAKRGRFRCTWDVDRQVAASLQNVVRPTLLERCIRHHVGRDPEPVKRLPQPSGFYLHGDTTRSLSDCSPRQVSMTLTTITRPVNCLYTQR